MKNGGNKKMERKLVSSDEVLGELNKSAEFRKEKRKLNPFFDLVVEIINRRNELGLSQKELAERAGTHQSRISKIESAEFDVRLSTLIEIAEALDTELKIKMVPIVEHEHQDIGDFYKQLFKASSVVVSSDSSQNSTVNISLK
jgi:predicted transcriptional regulator